MAVRFYKNGKWHLLAGKKVYTGGTFQTMKKTDKIRLNRQWYPLGAYLYKVQSPANGITDAYIRGTGAFTIFFGDGSVEKYTMNDSTVEVRHTYADSNIYEVSIFFSGTIASVQFNGCAEIDIEALEALNLEGFNSSKATFETIDLSTLTTLNSVTLYGCDNLTSVNLQGLSNLNTIVCNGALTEINITGCPLLIHVQLQNNNLSESWVDYVLQTLAANNQINGNLNISGNSAPSQKKGQGYKELLIDRGWTVTTD